MFWPSPSPVPGELSCHQLLQVSKYCFDVSPILQLTFLQGMLEIPVYRLLRRTFCFFLLIYRFSDAIARSSTMRVGHSAGSLFYPRFC